MGQDRRLKLPQLRRVGRAYYFDTQAKPRRWIALGSDEAQALKRYRELRGEVAAGADSVDRMLDEHARSLAASGKVKPSTLRQYGFLHVHLSRVLGHCQASALTQADVARYLEECPRTSARGEVSYLSGAYYRWLRLGRIAFNPCIGAKTDKPRSRRDRLLTLAELHAIIANGKPALGLAIELAYATGFRISDLLALRWDDFGEGEQIRTLKTGARQRYELDDNLRDILGRAKALHGRVVGLTVLAGRAGRPLKRGTVERWWREACAAAGVHGAHFHDIRAAAGTEVERLDGEVAAQRFLGHKDPATTRIYLRGRRVALLKPLKLARPA